LGDRPRIFSSEMKLRRLQQALFLPWTVENDKRQLLAQSRSTSESVTSSGTFLVVLQKTMNIMLPPRISDSVSFLFHTSWKRLQRLFCRVLTAFVQFLCARSYTMKYRKNVDAKFIANTIQIVISKASTLVDVMQYQRRYGN